MDHLAEYSQLMTFIYPVFSGITCGLLLLLSMSDSLSRTEIRIKRLTVAYLFVTAFNWFGSFLFGYAPEAFVYINTLLLASYMYAQILLFWLFRILTATKQNERLSPWHHLAPVILSGTLFVWSLLVPFEIQVQIVQSKGTVFPEGYEVYGRYFTSKPLIRLMFSITYTSMIIVRLAGYYRRVNTSASLVRRPARWVIFLIALMVILVLAPAVGTFTPRSVVFSSFPSKIAAFAIFCQHTLLSYHILRRDYMLYITFPTEGEAVNIKQISNKESATPTCGKQTTTSKPRKPYTRKDKQLTKRDLEVYMNKHKPFLDPDFKITDLAEALDTNRTYISGFVNKTYGVNFNRYVNGCRLQELERLIQLPSNAGKHPRELVQKAGFSEYKQYSRAKAAENDDAGNLRQDTNGAKKAKL